MGWHFLKRNSVLYPYMIISRIVVSIFLTYEESAITRIKTIFLKFSNMCNHRRVEQQLFFPEKELLYFFTAIQNNILEFCKIRK